MENSTFIRDYFDELKKHDEVLSCTSMLISIGMSQDNPIMLEDMEIIEDFIRAIGNERLEVKYGLMSNGEGMGMTLLTICTKAVQ